MENKRVKDLTGNKYGMLTVVKFSGMVKSNSLWECVCECGNTTTIRARLLPSHKSCGCLSKENRMTTEKASTHGMSSDRLYSIWSGMKSRATNENNLRAKDYSERGIGVSEDWLEFEKFYADMGEPPSSKHSLERINNNLGYSKENCKWETPPRQMSNRRISTNTSGRIGVNFCLQTGKWKVRFKCDKVSIWLGRFDSFEDACEAIEKAELEYLGYSRKEGFIKEVSNALC